MRSSPERLTTGGGGSIAGVDFNPVDPYRHSLVGLAQDAGEESTARERMHRPGMALSWEVHPTVAQNAARLHFPDRDSREEIAPNLPLLRREDSTVFAEHQVPALDRSDRLKGTETGTQFVLMSNQCSGVRWCDAWISESSTWWFCLSRAEPIGREDAYVPEGARL